MYFNFWLVKKNLSDYHWNCENSGCPSYHQHILTALCFCNLHTCLVIGPYMARLNVLSNTRPNTYYIPCFEVAHKIASKYGQVGCGVALKRLSKSQSKVFVFTFLIGLKKSFLVVLHFCTSGVTTLFLQKQRYMIWW